MDIEMEVEQKWRGAEGDLPPAAAQSAPAPPVGQPVPAAPRTAPPLRPPPSTHCPFSLLPRLQHRCQQQGAAGRGGGHRLCPSPGGCGVGRLLAAAILGPDRWQAAPAQEAAGTEHSWAAGPGHPREKPHRVPGAEARRSQPVPHALCKQGMGKFSLAGRLCGWRATRSIPGGVLRGLVVTSPLSPPLVAPDHQWRWRWRSRCGCFPPKCAGMGEGEARCSPGDVLRGLLARSPAPRLFICAKKQGNKLSEANFVPCSDTASY